MCNSAFNLIQLYYLRTQLAPEQRNSLGTNQHASSNAQNERQTKEQWWHAEIYTQNTKSKAAMGLNCFKYSVWLNIFVALLIIQPPPTHLTVLSFLLK